ncbi:MAG TPA: NAD-dependent epimerase/dehydratase family protein [Candidatus Nitrosopelagicus sp.]|nr:NAD-dependent epimerase/dehydratase family protein [Candidatus Nitrosopelagicus sp.]
MTYLLNMNKIKSILVTGGAGYIGSVLTHKLVELGYNVRIIDSLIYGRDGISDLISKNSVELIEKDIRDEKTLNEAVKDIDCIIHLAAIVGDPFCKKIPVAAKQINEDATKKLVNISKKQGVKRFIFASTCSNYGSASTIVDENSPIQPLSLYSKTKVNSENFILNTKNSSFEPCILRFATAHGLSPRMRFDLLLQEFLRDAILDKKIRIYGPNSWRPLSHVDDISNACITTIKSSKNLISGQVYNVGNTSENYTKKMLAEIIQEFVPSTEIEITGSKTDLRTYKVSFDKIKNNLKFISKKTIRNSIQDILSKIEKGNLDPRASEFSNMSKLTERVKAF